MSDLRDEAQLRGLSCYANRDDPPPPKHLPKPTTEEWADKVLADRDAKVRAKAFEEAAEAADKKSVEMHKAPRNCFCHIDVEVLADSFRTLAKE